MLNLKDIKESIEKLSPGDIEELKRWIIEKHCDRQIEEDILAGKLDFLIEEAEKELKEGKLHDL